jgi:ribosome-binding factor A
MLVYVEFPAAAQAGGHVADVMERLASANGFLRREVAAAITRKRAPELVFIVVAGGNREEVTP